MKKIFSLLILCFVTIGAFASDADLAIPDLHNGTFPLFFHLNAYQLLLYGSLVIMGTLGISIYLRGQIKKMPAHKSMLDVAETIFQTCRTYLIQQGKFLLTLFRLCIAFLCYIISWVDTCISVILVVWFSIVGMAGSYAVAWYGIRINTFANARTAFASLRANLGML